METGDLLQKLLENPALQRNIACSDNVIMLGEALVSSFGLDQAQPRHLPDLGLGYTRVQHFLETVCPAFDNPTHVVRVSPFSYVYLGSDTFNRALDIILARAQRNPSERPWLDEVFTATALLKPEFRAEFLDMVKTAEYMDNESYGLGDIVASLDPHLSFTSTADFPRELNTSDVRKATEMIGHFAAMGLFSSGIGFSKEYYALRKSMGSFDYLLKDPREDLVMVVTPGKNERFITEMVSGHNFQLETTPNFKARPHYNGDNPAVVVVNAAVSPQQVRDFYRASTVLYLSRTRGERKSIEEALAEGNNSRMLVDVSSLSPQETQMFLLDNLNFVHQQRQEHGSVDYGQMLEAELQKARELIVAGNEHFYDLRDLFTSLGHRKMVDQMVNAEGHTLPLRTDYQLILLLSEEKDYLRSMFKDATRKKLHHSTDLPPVQETGLPFVLITDMAIPHSQFLGRYPSCTIMYVAKDEDQERSILHANKGEKPFVLNATQMQNNLRTRQLAEVGYVLAHGFFDKIAESRGKGVTDMMQIAEGISQEVKKIRDEILFAPLLRDFSKIASHYFSRQELYRGTPVLLQLTDRVMMEACPTGGCFDLARPEKGGCCGGGNLPRVLIDYAIAYRRQVGDQRFNAGIRKFNDGKVKEPWYFQTREYQHYFKDLGADDKAAKGKKKMTF